MAEPTFVILGGGPAGCAAAIALRRSGVGTVVVAEGGTYESDRIGESVPPDTRRLFARLGLLEAFEREGHEPCYGSCSSWGDDVLGYNDFTVNPNGTGFHLDRRRFDTFLAHRARKAGAHLVTGARFRSVRPYQEGTGEPAFVVELRTSTGVRRLKASFVIDAMGSGARLARYLGAQRLVHDRFFCATGYFHLHDEAEFTQLTMLEAVPDGWWYAARLPDRRIAVALACDGDASVGEARRVPPSVGDGLEHRELGELGLVMQVEVAGREEDPVVDQPLGAKVAGEPCPAAHGVDHEGCLQSTDTGAGPELHDECRLSGPLLVGPNRSKSCARDQMCAGLPGAVRQEGVEAPTIQMESGPVGIDGEVVVAKDVVAPGRATAVARLVSFPFERLEEAQSREQPAGVRRDALADPVGLVGAALRDDHGPDPGPAQRDGSRAPRRSSTQDDEGRFRHARQSSGSLAWC